MTTHAGVSRSVKIRPVKREEATVFAIKTSKTVPWFLSLLVLALMIAGCVGTGGSTSAPASDLPDSATPPGAGDFSMGGEALGGTAATTLLAEVALSGETLTGNLAWVAHEMRLGAGEVLEHSHEFGFVYAREGSHLLGEGSELQELQPTEGAVVLSDIFHRHEASDEPSVFWEIRLGAPGSQPPPNTSNGRLIFESDPLEGIPSAPQAVFVHVLVPSGGQTSVHTHPGPEFIYQLSGRIEYENALIGSIVMVPGDTEGIPPEVPVQKRNVYEDEAGFLSWFLVDPAEPFASPARFAPLEIAGENVALLERGATVVGVSSNFGNGGNDSAFGANNAFDGDPSTEWSSNGDGDDAWIEIELPTETHVTTIGFWTRTMGATAQVFSFRVITDRGETHGPFEVGDAGSTNYFDTDLTAKRLRFEIVDSSGGNTGALEIEVYA